MPSQKQQQTQNAIWIVENWCVVKHTNREQRLDACQEVMNGDIHERWRAYWESPSSHVGERNAKNDNNEEHCGKVELDACREVIDPEVHKWRMSYWESPSKNVERRNASTAC